MLLSDADIRREISARRIVFTPRLEKSQIGGASVDLTLDERFWTFGKAALGKKVLDLKTDLAENSFEEHKWKFCILDPGALVLGITRERIKLAADIMGNLEGRSRYARMGLAVHVTSALVQPGVDNHQVLEIVNFGPKPLKVWAGMRISQVVFEYLKTPASKLYRKTGKIARRQ